MKHRIIYDNKEVIDIIESTNDITIYPSGVYAMEGNLDNCKVALMSLAINTDKIDSFMNIEPIEISNLLEVPISPHPEDATITRVARVASEHDVNEKNEYHFNLRIKHFNAEGEHIKNLDKTLKLKATNNYFVEFPEGQMMGEYDYLLYLKNNGVDTDVIKVQTITDEDKKPIEENRFNKVY